MNGQKTVIGLVCLAALAGCNDGSKRHWGPTEAPLRTVPAGSTVEARVGHVAVVTSGGKVLLAGGATDSEAATATLEVYDPAAGTSQPLVATLAVPRARHQGVVLDDGRVWLIGGRDAQGRGLVSTEVFDPATRSVAPGPALQAQRVGAALARVDHRLVIAGGRGEASVEIWDLRTLTLWASAGFGLPHPVEGAQLLRVSEHILALVGGRDARGVDLPPVWLDLDAERSASQDGGEWLHGGVGVVHPGATGDEAWVLSGTLESSGAYNREGQRLQEPPGFERGEVGAYPPAFALETFDARVVIGEPRTRPAALSTPGGVVVVGGTTRQGHPSAVVELIEVGRTRLGDPLQVPRTDGAVTLLADGRVVLTGGRDASGRAVALVEQLVPGDAEGPDASLVFARREAELAEWARLHADLDRVRGLLAGEEAETARLRDELGSAVAELRQRQAEIGRLQGELAKLIGQLSQSQAQAQALSSQLRDVQAQLARTQAALSAAQAEVSRLRGELAAAQAELTRLRQVEGDLRAQLAASRAAPAPAPAPGPATLAPPRVFKGTSFRLN
jgi:hypothetical protein